MTQKSFKIASTDSAKKVKLVQLETLLLELAAADPPPAAALELELAAAAELELI